MSTARCVIRWAFVAQLVGLCSSAAASDSSLRCDGGVVQLGDTKIELLAKCGEPALRDPRPVIEGNLLAPGAATAATVEDWTYDFGPNRFLMVVRLLGGKIVSIDRGGYGYDAGRTGGRAGAGAGAAETRCEASAIHVGDLKRDLLARCGEPATRDLRTEQRELPRQSADAAPRFGTVQIEVWMYDLGPQRFIAIATLEDGKVVRVEHGGYGSAR